MKISRVAEMRSLDRRAIEKYGIPGVILMENAGEATYFVILKEFGVVGKRFVVVCGAGHNGGDGLVVARKLFSMRADVQIFCLGTSDRFDNTVNYHYQMVEHIGIPFVSLPADDLSPLRAALTSADAVVDAIFGTGLSREVKGRYAEAIRLINAAGKPVFSIDIPSGIAGDTGEVMGVAVKASYTVTYGLPKWGNLLYPGFEHGGRLFVTHISFPPESYQSDEIAAEVNMPLPPTPRPPDGHKGTFGKVMFVAGAMRYQGAPYFAAMSFLKAGGGLSYLATPRSVAPFIASKGSEIVFLPQPETASGSLTYAALDALLEAAEDMDMLVLGPGISLDEETQRLARELAARLDLPLVIDGDGLTALAGHTEILSRRTAPTALTPHPGEMARLLGMPMKEVLANRVDLLRQAAADWNAVVVFKGAHSLIGYPDGRVFLNLTGNAGMATAGSGDVLTGTIAAMYAAHHYEFADAVRMGVLMHGLAGDCAAEDLGEDGMVAGDILAHLPDAIRRYRAEWRSFAENYFGKISVV